MTAEEAAGKIVEILDSKKARDISVIDVEGKTILADRFVIATGTSVTHIKSLAGEVEFQMKDKYCRVPIMLKDTKQVAGYYLILMM